jgi:hypothetical protein
MDTVPPLASVDWERDTMFVPASTKRVPVTPVEPAVFPRLDTPAEYPAPPPDGTEMTTEPPVTPTDAIPAPPKESADLCAVPEVDWVVLDTANIESDWFTEAESVLPLTEKVTPLASVTRTVPDEIEFAPS